MKKNKLIYILLFIIALFSFKENIYADLESEVKEKSCKQLKEEGTLDPKSEAIIFDGSGYDANCVYELTETSGNINLYKWHWGNVKSRCVIIQIAFNKDGEYKLAHYGDKTGIVDYYYMEENGFREKAVELDQNYFASREGICPIGVDYDYQGADGSHISQENFRIGATKHNMTRIHKTDVIVTIDPLITDLDDIDPKNTSCEAILGEKGVGILKTIKTLLQIVVPIILLVLGSLDFGKAIFAGDENDMKKSQQKFIKRVIFSIAIFMIPIILQVVLGIAHDIWPVVDNTLCGIYGEKETNKE